MGLQINLLQITKTLEGVKYPANKQQLVGYVREAGAGEEVLDALQKLPERVFNAPAELNDALRGI